MVKWFAQVYRRPAIQATVIFPVESRRPRLEAVGVDWSTLVVKEAGFRLSPESKVPENDAIGIGSMP